MNAFLSLFGISRVRSVAHGIIFIQINVIYASVIRSKCSDHLVLLFSLILLLKKLLIGFLELPTRFFLVHDLTLGASLVTNEQYDDNGRYYDDRRSEECHVIKEHINNRIGVKLIGVSECEILRIVLT